MHWLAPANLFWLLPIGGGIVLLWLLKPKRVEQTISSLYLWRAVQTDTRANSPLQRLRRHPLLFLQLLAAFLLVLALARPYALGQARRATATIWVVDTSASMGARDDGVSRLDTARDTVRREIRALGSGDMGAIVTAGARPAVVCGWTGDVGRLSDAAGAIAGSDAPGSLATAVKLAQSVAGSQVGARIQVVSDGVLSPAERAALDALPPSPAAVSQVVVGSQDAANIGIVSLSSGRDPDTGQTAIFVQVQKWGEFATRGATLSVTCGGKLVDARELSFDGAGQMTETFSSPVLNAGGIVTARLDGVADALRADNEASLTLAPARTRHVLLVSEGNLFLERGLSLAPLTDVAECAPADWAGTAKAGAGYDVVVFDGWVPPSGLPPSGGFLVVGTVGSALPLQASGSALAGPIVTGQTHDAAVLRFVDLSNLKLRAAPRTRLSSGAVSLVDGTAGPLLAEAASGTRRIVQVAFALSDSDWPVRVSFPIFLLNAMDELGNADRPGAAQPSFSTGTTALVTLEAGVRSAAVTPPSGAAFPVPVTDGVARLSETDAVGIYHVHPNTGGDYPVAVNLLSSGEGNLPAQQLGALHRPGLAAGGSSSLRRIPQEWGLWAGLLALCLLVGEWAWWNRRPPERNLS